MTDKRFIFVIGFAFVAWVDHALAVDRGRLPVGLDILLGIKTDMSLPHEGQPGGVPLDYDWVYRPRLGAGNDAGNFLAFTGWGQVFPVKGNPATSISIKIRDMRVLACHGKERKWVLLQQGVIEGSQFRPDYQGNINKPPLHVSHAAGETSVRFEKGAAYHFWPKQGRVDLPARELCGIVVMLQAKTIPPSREDKPGKGKGGVLLGLGADYWKDKGATWDHYQSNRDVAIGRLKWLTKSWHWFGLTTAPIEDLRRLHAQGYEFDASHSQ